MRVVVANLMTIILYVVISGGLIPITLEPSKAKQCYLIMAFLCGWSQDFLINALRSLRNSSIYRGFTRSESPSPKEAAPADA